MELAKLNGGELVDCLVTRCEQLDGLLQERRETLFSLEANHDQVSSVVSSEFEGASAADGCTRSLGGIEAPGTLVGTRFPSVIVPVCVGGKVCVKETPCTKETPRVSVPACASSMVCVKETARVSERPSVRGTACVRSLYEGNDSRHAGTRNRVSRCECPGVVCERRNTQECVCGMELERESVTETTATEERGPSRGRSYFGDRAEFARR